MKVINATLIVFLLIGACLVMLSWQSCSSTRTYGQTCGSCNKFMKEVEPIFSSYLEISNFFLSPWQPN
ncbi:hypothetical protein EB796_004174 [Bugula neritina]|uniref:Uncharacterized protein n=1 Tax=Bugula neritina TaxID=10212 RepID=A0A7J7KFR3_BUGNE|nr:hypothetical protein EB796_004174 [Bugula neritina]